MNRAEKLQLIIEDDKRIDQKQILEEQRRLEQQRKELEQQKKNIDLALDKPPSFDQKIDNPFQTAEVEANSIEPRVYKLAVPENQALVITDIANEWYPGLTFVLEVDGNKREYQRVIADPTEPRNVKMLAENRVTWTVENDSDEDRNVGILTDGHYVSQSIYEQIKDNSDNSEDLILA